MSNIEHLLGLSNSLSYHKVTHEGKYYLKGKSIVLSMLARNCAKVLAQNVEILKSAIAPFVKDYKFVIFENDSNDKTKDILMELANLDNNIIFHSFSLHRKMYGPSQNNERTQNLAEYRNFNKNYISKNFDTYDYVIVCDSDFIDISVNGLYHSFGLLSQKTKKALAICGNSYQLTIDQELWNYDSWAYRLDSWEDKTKKMPIDWFGRKIMSLDTSPYIVNSAFGGMAIYKLSDYIYGKYSGGDCEHVNFHKSLKQNNKNFRLLLNPSQAMLLSGLPPIPYSNKRYLS